MGYYRAGFDQIVGVDWRAQRNYPFEFHQADALEYLALLCASGARNGDGFDAVHASPPCQAYSLMAYCTGRTYRDWIPETRLALKQTGLPYVIENVCRAPLENSIELCGTMFGLKVYRHRAFECNLLLLAPGHLPHRDHMIQQGRGCSPKGFITVTGHGGFAGYTAYARLAMGIDWMSQEELAQAVPPAYTEFVGRQLMMWITKGGEK